MSRPTRLILGVATLLAVVAGLLWWTRSVRLTPLEPNRLAAMSETEQVAWLIERALERSERPGFIRKKLYEWFPRLRTKWEPFHDEFATLTRACAEYDLWEPLQRLRRWARDPLDKDSLHFAEAQLWARRGDTAKASQTMRGISDIAVKARAYSTVATELNRAGQRDEARRVLQEAVAQLPQDKDLIVSMAAQLGFPDLAEQAATRIADRMFREHALAADVVPAYARAGQDSEAIRVARQISDRVVRGLAYAEIAHMRMQRGQWTEAVALIEQAREPTGYARVARYLAGQGRPALARPLWQKAEQLARRLPEPSRSRALFQIATEYARAGDLDAAMRLCNQADEAKGRPESVRAFHAIARAYAAKGKREQAVAVVEQRFPSLASTVIPYSLLARELYRNGYYEDARLVLQRLHARLQREFPRNWYTDYAWLFTVDSLASPDTLPLAREIIGWLERETQSITNPRERYFLDRRLAVLHAQTGDLPRAVHYAARLPHNESQASALIEILQVVVERRESREGR